MHAISPCPRAALQESVYLRGHQEVTTRPLQEGEPLLGPSKLLGSMIDVLSETTQRVQIPTY